MHSSKQIFGLIRKLLHNNRFVAVFSLVCAVIFWLVISITQTPEITREIDGVSVIINTQGTKAEELQLEVFSNDIPKKTSVTVSGPYYIVSSLKSSDLVVNANVANVVEAGEYDIELKARKNSSKTGYTIVSCEIEELRNVRFDVRGEAVKEVLPYLDNVSLDDEAKAKDYKIGVAEVANSLYHQITIQGPQSEIDKIKQVRAVVSDKTLSKTEKFLVDIIIVDQNENKMDASVFNLDFDQVEVTVPVVKEKTVGVEVVFSPSGIQGLKYDAPQTITIVGEPDEIDAFTGPVKVSVDLSKVTKEHVNNKKYICEASTNLSPNIDIVESADRTVEVTVNLENYIVRSVKINSINTKNVEEGLKATPLNLPVNVDICGPKNQVNSIDVKKLVAEADCAGKTPSQQSIECSVNLFGYTSSWVIGEPTVQIEISEN